MNNIALIDADTIIYLATYNKKEEKVKSIQQMFDCCDQILENILNVCETRHYAGFLTDGSHRYKIATIKPYKGNRINTPKPKYYNLIKAYLSDHLEFKSIKNYEADDLCIMAHNTFTNNKEYNPIICSPDKDLRQVEGTFYDYKKLELVNVSKEQSDYNFWFQMLTGDTSDNIQGCIGIGSVKADKILNEGKYPFFYEKVKNTYVNIYKEEAVKHFDENYDLLNLLKTYEGLAYYPYVVIKEKEKKEEELEW